MKGRSVLAVPALAVLTLALGAGGSGGAQVAAPTASAKLWRTPWGHPNLEGTWSSDDVRGIPLQRDEKFGTRAELTDEEFAERQQGNDAQVSRLREGGTAFLAERGVRTFRQTSLVVDPPNGRIPALTAEGQKRTDETQARRRSRPSSWEDRSLYDRCLTRGPIGSILPVIYGNGLEIHQTPNDVVIRYEMIHETRIIPLQVKPRLGDAIKMYMGDARGRFEGDTLVVETTNFDPRTAYQNSNGDTLKIIERFKPIAADKVEWTVRLEDPTTWARPWAFQMNLTKDASQGVYEYACHEGNLGLKNILSAARSEEAAAKR
jgi:hypothetical protein